MNVLCTVALLSVRSLLQLWRIAPQLEDQQLEWPYQDYCCSNCLHKLHSRSRRRSREGVNHEQCRHNMPEPARQSSPLIDPAVMFGSRKTWDISHTPCLQELWRKDISLDTSSVDFLMSDGEEDPSFLLLQTSSYPRHLTSDLSTQGDQKLTIQDKVCNFQASLYSEETGRRIQVLRQRWTREKQLQALVSSVHGLRTISQKLETQIQPIQSAGSGKLVGCSSPVQKDQGQLQEDLCSSQNRLHIQNEQEVLIDQLCTKVGKLEEKLLEQSQEVEKLCSELGATDLEKQLEVVVLENKRLRQELSSCLRSQVRTASCGL
ncbi:hypothetical protein Z043_106938 [Scleropages formosus]|uniref:Uncharacterized protein n=1 Tax=Scleropages formosus TaxID=113540 RepID=A0A0P7XEQ4_SCLFO|nr:hypothetical protein Z043_106938 [Scleropages formosus]